MAFEFGEKESSVFPGRGPRDPKFRTERFHDSFERQPLLDRAPDAFADQVRAEDTSAPRIEDNDSIVARRQRLPD